MDNITVLTIQTYDTLTINKHKVLAMMASCMVSFQPFHCVVFFFSLGLTCDTFTEHHKAIRLVTQRHVVKTDVWLSISRSSFLISEQFINSTSRSVIKVTLKSGLCQAPLALYRGSLQMAKSQYWLIVSILWTGMELVLQGTSYLGAQRAWICFFLCKPQQFIIQTANTKL